MEEEKNKSFEKNQAATFTADNIDNTAPVKKILDELQHKNPKAYMFYCQNVRQRRTTRKALMNYHYVLPGHPLNAFDDNWDGELNMDYFEQFPYKGLPPKMITALKYMQETDPVTSLLNNKLQWRHTCRSVKLTASFRNVLNKYESLNEDVVRCPKHMVDIAAHLDRDPDPFFESPYNWYYAGNGNLQLLCIDWVDYLVHSEFNSVYLAEFCKNDLVIKPYHVASFDCGKGNNIFETICTEPNILVLRTKHKIYILKLIKINDNITIEKLKCVGSELPYTSITFDNFHKNILYITTLDNKLSIVNLDRLKARTMRLKGNLKSLVNNWNSVIGSGRGLFTHAGKETVTIYDKRSNKVIFVWKDLRKITDDITCNDISVARHLEGGNSLYFGTDHHLFLMDTRFCTSKDPKVVRRWTHGMECVPAYFTYCSFEFSKDLICLSSQWCEDMCVVPNYNDRLITGTDSGVTIPYRPPSILGTLNEAKQKMLCHNLYNPIDARLCTSITGCLILDQGEKYDILMQNSFGDISCHSLYPQHMESFIEDDSAQNLHDWSASYIPEQKDFEVSKIQNIASIWKQLRRVPDDVQIESDFHKEKSKFSEQEVIDTFENEEIDVGLQEVWLNGEGEAENIGDDSAALKLDYSDEEFNS